MTVMVMSLPRSRHRAGVTSRGCGIACGPAPESSVAGHSLIANSRNRVRIGPDAAARMEGASALIAAGGGPDGAPVATRAWGAVVQEDGAAVRVYLEADDTTVLELLTPGRAIAGTGADVKALSSAQAKGRVRSVEDLTALDVAIRERSTDLFVQ